MSFYPKGFFALGLVLLLVGGGLYLTQDDSYASPPRIAKKSTNVQKSVEDPVPDLPALAGPWYQTPPPRPRVMPAAPPPVVAKAPDPVDKKSVAFLGLYREKDGSPAYFFKFLPSGTVMILKPSRPNKGWELVDIQAHIFSLTGPGGHYEVSY